MKNPHFEIGMTAIDVLLEIMRVNPKITSLKFHSYISKENLKERVRQIPPMAQLRHDDSNRDTTLYFREQLTSLEVRTKLLEEYGWAKGVKGVLSLVEYGNKIFHIPMMDFCCDKAEDNLSIIRKFLEKVNQKSGAILFSGRSYHYYGAKLFTEGEWLKFLGFCLLFTGYVDERYVGHRLLDGCGILRISAGGIKMTIPKVVSIL